VGTSCRSGREITFRPYTLCEPDKARVSVFVSSQFAGVEPRSFRLHFPECIEDYGVPQGMTLDECVDRVTIHPSDPPDPQRFAYSFAGANRTGLVVTVSCTLPATSNRVSRELILPWLVNTASTNSDFRYHTIWTTEAPNNTSEHIP